jgi:hypothetical protein
VCLNHESQLHTKSPDNIEINLEIEFTLMADLTDKALNKDNLPSAFTGFIK